MSTYFGNQRKSGNAVDRTQTVADVFVRTGPGGSVYYNITSWKQANNAVKLSCGYNSSPTKSRRVSVIGQQSAGSHETNAKSRRDNDVRPRSNVGNTKSPFSAIVTEHRRKSGIAVDQRQIADCWQMDLVEQSQIKAWKVVPRQEISAILQSNYEITVVWRSIVMW